MARPPYLLALCLICSVSISNYFAYHAPSATVARWEHRYNLSTREFGGLFTIYSAPNVVLVFFSGKLVDRYGVRSAAVGFNILIVLGMIACALAPRNGANLLGASPYAWLLLGRTLLGLGGESVCVCVFVMLSKWFRKRGLLNTAMALNQATVQVLGSSAAFYVLPRCSLKRSLWLAVGVAMASLLATVAYHRVEAAWEAHLDDEEEEAAPGYAAVAQAEAKEKEAKPMASRVFWVILVQIAFTTPVLYTFTAFGAAYLDEDFPNVERGADAVTVLYLAIATAPLAGAIVDRTGRRALVQCAATAQIPLALAALALRLLRPSVCLGWMGVSYAFSEPNSLALVALAVEPEWQGTAFGLEGCAISAALLIEPLVVGAMRDATASFQASIWLFVALTAAGAIASLFLLVTDTDNLLNQKPTRARRVAIDAADQTPTPT
ncbi:major facilitator superfamily domain-containing protein [Pelagophyceae sp. CCMP2097]|nr:major facilitator superfamily domain-containing protein [Pelagophyceae sp. CCMP2097]